MKKNERVFFNVFTELQCLILARMNSSNINGVTATHYNIIEFIYRNKKTTGKHIAEAFKISQAAISRQLKFLLNNDFIIQRQNEADRRIFNLEATEKGRDIVDKSGSFRAYFTNQASRTLSDKELETLAGLLDKVLHAMQE